MLKRKLSVGSQIDAWCGSCKVERSHTIAAIDPDGTVNRVTCEHCNSYHRYRAPAAAAATKTRRASSARTAAVPAASRVVRNYDRSEKYAVGELIDHPKHGRGTITEVAAPTKIRVKFFDGERTLLQAMP
ncbi:MAG TPA: hypothetical protein VFC63_22315 [Blastocatellia bacterium]|nr:hypothetical protein [Blastocatellia bacterium]